MTESAEAPPPARPIGRWSASLVFAVAVIAAGYSSADIGVAGGSVQRQPQPIATGPTEPGLVDGAGPTVGRAYGLDAETPLVPSEPLARGGDATGPRVVTEQPSLPVRVTIERIGLTSQLVLLGLTGTGELQVPAGEYYDYAGWYRHGAIPGEAGPAVIAGHLDSDRAPSVFYRLREVVPGDVVVIDRADGSVLRFVVDRVAQYSKDAFPTAAVYGPTADSQLRLITCGGRFDRDAGGYGDNFIVFATRA